jgi:glycosyltransferase involved in cell wall biosynthesis
MGRVRVMHLVVGGDIGGAERLLVDLVRRPAETGAEHEVALVTPNPALKAYLAQAGVRIHDRGPVREGPLSYLVRSLGPRDVAWLASLLARERADVLHTHTFGTHVLGTRAARRAGTPQLRTEHHVMHYEDASTTFFTRWAAARTDAFVAVSEYVKSRLARLAPAVHARTTVVRNGVDTSYFAPREARDPAEGAGAPGDAARARFVIVCRLTAWKRVELAIAAASLAEVELLVVGDGEERAKLEALAAKLSARVRFVGRQEDPRPFVASCDATLSTARDEPLGLSVLESLAMERPVIALAGGGISEIVEDGETGMLVREATAPALAETLRRASQDRARLRRMGTAGRRFALASSSTNRMCEGYAGVYDALVSRGARGASRRVFLP